MKGIPPWVTYTVLRLLAIAVPLAILLVVVPSRYWVVSVVAAVIIGLCLSYLFLAKQRQAVANDLSERRNRKRPTTSDDDAEDAEIDREAAASDRAAAASDRAAAESEGERRTEAGAVQQADDPGQL